MRVPSAQWLRHNHGQLTSWLLSKWRLRADDVMRPWREQSNALTDALSPGFLVQSAVSGFEPRNGGGKQVLELKVEVFWGHAHFAVENSFRVFFLRDDHATERAEQEFRCLKVDGSIVPPSSWWHSVAYDGHLECAWELAERTAKRMAIDSVRIDIFLNPDDPRGCTLNEISLSSAMETGDHFRFFTFLWIEPHLKRSYHLLDTDKPVFQLDGTETRRPAGDGGAEPTNTSLTWWWWCGECPAPSHRTGQVGFDCAAWRTGSKPGETGTMMSAMSAISAVMCDVCQEQWIACAP